MDKHSKICLSKKYTKWKKENKGKAKGWDIILNKIRSKKGNAESVKAIKALIE